VKRGWRGALGSGTAGGRDERPRARSVWAVQLRLDRDSVHAGDDTVAHATVIEIEPWRKLRTVISDVVSTRHYLASIIGGEATWIVEGAPGHLALAVVAQQWDEPVLLVRNRAIERFGELLYFAYLAQVAANEILERLRGEAR
jgi:hypothetical protein